MKRESIIEWIRSLVIALVVLFIINLFFGTTAVINTSMYPNLQEGDMVLLSKTGEIRRGDVVTFESTLTITAGDIERLDPLRKLLVKEGDPKNLIKRVIGMPGDEFDIIGGKIYVNGNELDESSYFLGETEGDVHIGTIPEGEYFLMGDNRPLSLDSRSDAVSLVKAEAIIGKVLLRYWPLTRLELFRRVY